MLKWVVYILGNKVFFFFREVGEIFDNNKKGKIYIRSDENRYFEEEIIF